MRLKDVVSCIHQYIYVYIQGNMVYKYISIYKIIYEVYIYKYRHVNLYANVLQRCTNTEEKLHTTSYKYQVPTSAKYLEDSNTGAAHHCIRAQTYTYTHTHMHIYPYTHIYVYLIALYTHIHTHTSIYVPAYTHIHTHTSIHVPTYTHIHTHTHTRAYHKEQGAF
jgi:hypothetical protein